MSEEWRVVKGYEQYRVSNTGKVVSIRTGKLLSPFLSQFGYKQLYLFSNGKKKKVFVHRLVIEAFIEKPTKFETNHKNGIKTDNRIENLEWLTTKENQRHASRTGLHVQPQGQDHVMSKLTSEQVREIRRKHEDGYTQVALAKEYGVAQNRIFRIVKGLSYRNAGSPSKPVDRHYLSKKIEEAERRGEERERERTEKLWDLLDSIDSLPDMLHPNDSSAHEKCWKMMVKRAEKRHEVLQSDGYSLKPTLELTDLERQLLGGGA